MPLDLRIRIRTESLRAAYINCAPKDGQIPSPRTVQAFLAMWKVLWQWRQNVKRGKPPNVDEVKRLTALTIPVRVSEQNCSSPDWRLFFGR